MNKEDLYRLLGEVDEEFIEEAKTERITTKKVRWFPAVAAAAVVIICLMTGNYVWRQFVQGPTAQGDVTLAKNDTSAEGLTEEQEPVFSKAGKYKEEQPENVQSAGPMPREDTQQGSAQGENQAPAQYQDQSGAEEIQEIPDSPRQTSEESIENNGMENMGQDQNNQDGSTETNPDSSEGEASNGEGTSNTDAQQGGTETKEPVPVQESPISVSEIIGGSTITFQTIAYSYGGPVQEQQVGQTLGVGTVVTTSGTTLNGSVYEMTGTDVSQSIIVQADNDSGYYSFVAPPPVQDSLFEAEY